MKLFKKVHCKAYLKTIKDGVYIQFYNPDGSFCDKKYIDDTDNIKAIAYKKSDNPNLCEEELADLSEFDGSYVNKTYRERIECDFDGFVVGFTKVDTKGIIGTDWESDEYTKSHGYCFKIIKEHPKVAVVYFKNNVKRYVLLDDLTYVED